MQKIRKSLVVFVAVAASVVMMRAGAAQPGANAPNGGDKWLWSSNLGLGYDSNAFRTPDTPYVDYAQVGNPTIVPDIQSGFFVPYGFEAQYTSPTSERANVIAVFDFDGDLYLKSSLDNADNYRYEFALGQESRLDGEGARPDTFYGGVRFGHRQKVYYDRDSGLEQLSGAGVDVSDRYSYSNLGLEGRLEGELGAADYTVKFGFEQRDYSDPVVVAQYDHNYLLLGADLDYSMAAATKLKFGYDYFVRDYDERRARDVNGSLSLANPALEYSYHSFDLTMRHRLNSKWVTYFGYRRTLRDDSYVGYYDYTSDRLRARAIYHPNEDLRVRLVLSYWNWDFPNAFAFNEPTQPSLDEDQVELDLQAELAQTRERSIWAEFTYRDRGSNDLRYAYNRYAAMVGAKWEY